MSLVDGGFDVDQGFFEAMHVDFGPARALGGRLEWARSRRRLARLFGMRYGQIR